MAAIASHVELRLESASVAINGGMIGGFVIILSFSQNRGVVGFGSCPDEIDFILLTICAAFWAPSRIVSSMFFCSAAWLLAISFESSSMISLSISSSKFVINTVYTFNHDELKGKL